MTSMPQLPREDRDYTVVIQDDLRPAGNGKDCFYCREPLGTPHKADCVIRKGAGQYVVALRDNESGEIRLYRYDMEWEDDETDRFMWTEGNYGCDCNRHLAFLRAGGPGPTGDPHWNHAERECGMERYTALYAELPDGRRITLDEQPDQLSDQ